MPAHVSPDPLFFFFFGVVYGIAGQFYLLMVSQELNKPVPQQPTI